MKQHILALLIAGLLVGGSVAASAASRHPAKQATPAAPQSPGPYPTATAMP